MSDLVGIRVDMRSYIDQGALRGKYHNPVVSLLKKVGAYTRRDVRSSMKYSKAKPSAPGQPPRYHRRGKGVFNLRNRIYFYVDYSRMSVLIAPNAKTARIARVHEEGLSPVIRARKYAVGQEGPIAQRGTRRGQPAMRVIRLRTQGQADRATQLMLARRARLQATRYRRRPFLAPQVGKMQARMIEGLKDIMSKG